MRSFLGEENISEHHWRGEFEANSGQEGNSLLRISPDHVLLLLALTLSDQPSPFSSHLITGADPALLFPFGLPDPGDYDLPSSLCLFNLFKPGRRSRLVTTTGMADNTPENVPPTILTSSMEAGGDFVTTILTSSMEASLSIAFFNDSIDVLPNSIDHLPPPSACNAHPTSVNDHHGLGFVRQSLTFRAPEGSDPETLADKIHSCIRKLCKGELIGCRAFGQVYMGMNLDSGELLAVKQMFVVVVQQVYTLKHEARLNGGFYVNLEANCCSLLFVFVGALSEESPGMSVLPQTGYIANHEPKNWMHQIRPVNFGRNCGEY
ncbi:unnamed protein product [Lactuca saligna]|uniref:Uncharacterized protein n=1 Tax=Lactuca saligna TaxID=75948 RepID=A0AA35UVU2_LACSI|nr:unnamed protein product [Lactuca saligna]